MKESDGSPAKLDQQEQISRALLNMNMRGLISSRSDVIALLSGELHQLRMQKSYLFKTSIVWESHYFLLTSIGILKFDVHNMSRAQLFVPLKKMISTDLIEDN